MTFTYLQPIATDRDRVRLLIPDRIWSEAIFQDDEIAAFLALEGSVKGAAALALETIAADEALVQKVQKTADFQTDGAKVADVLLKRASDLRSALSTRRAAVPVTGQLTTMAPVTPVWPPDGNAPAYGGSPYEPARRA